MLLLVLRPTDRAKIGRSPRSGDHPGRTAGPPPGIIYPSCLNQQISILISKALRHYTKATLWGPNGARPNPLKDDVMEIDRRSKFHRWRKTTYTMCAKAGGIAVAGKQLGHKTDMSAYYLDPSMLDDVQAADLMPVLPL